MRTLRSGRAHSFSGCSTCRRRHLKCDQSVPRCNRCRLAGLSCDFSPTLRWLVTTGRDVYDKPSSQPGDECDVEQFSRRHLYTVTQEHSRESMSAALVDNVPSTVAAALSKIDEKSKDIEALASIKFSVGPFSVFSCPFSDEGVSSHAQKASSILDGTNLTGTVPLSSSSLNQNETITERNSGEAHRQYPIFTDWGLNGLSDLSNPLSGSLDLLQWGDLFTTDFGLFDLTPSITDTPQTIGGNLGSTINGEVGNIPNIDTESLSFESLAWPEVDLVVDAPLLLKHFHDEVIDQMQSLPINQKSPWRILNFTSAILTLSQLTVLGMDRNTIKHANLANFYALIAVSSYHLSLNSATFPSLARPGAHWQCLSSRTYDAAKHHLNLSLEGESVPPRKAKYKEQLMAVIAILATAFLSGNEVDSCRYLTKMEHLIRCRGLSKPNVSRRARLLHNIYAWMRIVSESTNVLHENSPATALCHVNPNMSSRNERRSNNSSATQAIHPDTTLDNFLHHEPSQMHSAPDEHNDQDGERSIHDIHLARPLKNQGNMYMQIYGVPETWLSLVSQITRLANVMDRLSPGDKKSHAEAFASLLPKASYLEETVCLFKVHHQHNHHSNRDSDPSETNGETPHMHMVRALSSALVIFFYRRIRNVNPLLLQDSVDNVIRSLHTFDQALEECGLLGPGIAWPAFIAGAEAMTSHQRTEYISWLDKAFSKSGWAGYKVSMEILTEIWSQRDATGGTSNSVTWMDICRRTQRWPLLCP